MAPRPKRRRIASPLRSQTPMSLPELESYFRERFLDVTAPCTAERSSTKTTLGTPLKPCWIVENLGLFNVQLHCVGVELRKTFSGKLSLHTFVSYKTEEHRVVGAFLLGRLLSFHHCVESVDLRRGELLAEDSQLLSRPPPNAGLERISIDGSQVCKRELKQLVRAMLRVDPVKMNIRRVHFGGSQMAALVQSIETRTRLTDLDLSNNYLRGCDSVQLLEAIQTSNTIQCLNLDYNMVGVRGARCFAQLLKTTKSLARASLCNTKIQDKGAVAIGAALAVNTTLEFLLIRENSIGNVGAEALASSLRSNTCLTCLDLRKNRLRNTGAASFAQSLRSSETLQELDLGENGIGDEGIVEISNSLMNNRTLIGLSIDRNELGGGGIGALARLVASNDSLRRLNCVMSRFRWAPSPNVLVEALGLNRPLEGLKFTMVDPYAMERLSQNLPRIEHLQDLTVDVRLPHMTVLVDALAANRSIRVLEFQNRFMNLEDIRALERLLHTTTTMRSLALPNAHLGKEPLILLLHGLAFNSSLWNFRIGTQGLDIELCSSIAAMLMENRTLSALFLDNASVNEAGLMTIARGLSLNRFLVKLSIGYSESYASAFSIRESLRRNGDLLNRALQFALKMVTDKRSAEAFQLYQRSEFFVHELSVLPRVMTTSSAKSLVLKAKSYIARNYFIVTGVVKYKLVCQWTPRDRVTTQLDDLNADCLRKVVTYLGVSDVKG